MKHKQRILLLEADYTQSLPLVRSLHKKGYEVHGVFVSKLSYGYGSRYFNRRFLFPSPEDTDKYGQYLKELLQSIEYDAVIPMSDHSSIVLSKFKDEFTKKTHYDLPDFNAFQNGYDKHRLMEACQKNGFPHPRTVTIKGNNISEKEIQNLHFPVLIKPNFSDGARGITYAKTAKEVLELFPVVFQQYGDCHIQEFVPPGGAQIKIQVYIDQSGNLVQGSAIHKYRWYPNNGGSSCCNRSDNNEKLIDLCYRICKEIGWVGLADFDLIEHPDTGEVLVMELNPRLPACVKTTFKSGIDWGDVIASEYTGKSHPKYHYSKDVILRHLGFEVLWFINSKNRAHTKPNWFRFFGKNIYYQDMSDWTDPLPFILGSIGNIKKQFSAGFRETKSGIKI